jgi:anti-anti-sigma regulatory factor
LTLKIQISTTREIVVFTLIGRINADEVAELQRLFEAEGQDCRIVLDLKEVNLVDRDAVRFLARCEGNGVQIKHCPAYIREWIVREGAEANQCQHKQE